MHRSGQPLLGKLRAALRRGASALLNANVRYTRIVHGDRALADGRRPRRPVR